MMMLSNKRSHASTMAGSPPKSTIDAPEEGAKLTHTLSKSLHDLLLNNNESAAGDATHHDGGESESHSHQNLDVYHQYLNSPPEKSSSNDSQGRWERSGRMWLSSAMTTVGLGSNVDTLNFWKQYGRDNKEAFADARYLVWFVKDILLGMSDHMDGMSNGADEEHNMGDRLMAMLEQWHLSILDLLAKSGANADDDKHHGDATHVDSAEEDSAAGVMWQLLLQNAHLTPELLRDAMEKYVSPQDRYERSALSLSSIDDDIALPPEYFAWPSLLHTATLEAAEANSKEYDGAKRRRSNAGANYFKSERNRLGGEKKNTDWWPLLGYTIAHAFLSSNNFMTTQQMIHYLKENIVESLPTMLGIANFDYNTRNSLLSGILASILDKVGEWTVLDALVLSEMENLGSGEARINEEVYDRLRADVGQIVDLLLVNGILPKLANLTRTPLANLAGEAADALLNYSRVHNSLRNQNSSMPNEEENDDSLLQQHLANDAKQVVTFIEKAIPQLKIQLLRRNFNPSHCFSSSDSTDNSVPLNPIFIYNRSLLCSNDLPSAAKLCHTLEVSSGIDENTNSLCYWLLFEKMQDMGTLLDDGWNVEGVGATLANISVGALGRQCALEYLKNIVLEAKESLLLSGASCSGNRRSNSEREQAKHKLLCIKNVVRCTILRFLVPKPYSPHEALSIATELSDARSLPQLEHTSWGKDGNGDTADVVARRILRAPSFYNDNFNLVSGGDEDEVFEEDELLGVEKQKESVQGDFELVNVIEKESHKEQPAVAEEEFPMEESQRTHDVDESAADEKQEEEPSIDEREDEVIDIGGCEDEEIAVAEPPKERLAAASDETESVENSVQSPVEEKTIEQAATEEGNETVTYPPHYHQYPGNYSESDDYEEEDDEEADRHIAYEGEYDEDEGRGESEDDEGYPPPRPQLQEDEGLIEILDSSDDEEQEEMIEEWENVRDESSGEESDETKDLNEKVGRYIESHVEKSCEVQDGEVATAFANESEEERELQDEEARIPATGAKENNGAGQKAGAAVEIQAEGGAHKSDYEAASIDGQQDVVNPSDDEDVADYEPESPAAYGTEENVKEQIFQVEEEVVLSPASSAQPDSFVKVVNGKSPKAKTEGADEEQEEEGPTEVYNALFSGSDAKKENVVEERKMSTPEEQEMEGDNEEHNGPVMDEPTVAYAMEKDKFESEEEEPKESEQDAEVISNVGGDAPPEDAPYSSDNNLARDDTTEGTDDMSNMLADDEHESIDTEDDKRSLAEVPPSQEDETLDNAEGAPSSEAPFPHSNMAEEEVQEEEKPSVLVAAAMSSQLQGNNQTPAHCGLDPFELAAAEEGGGGDNRSFDHTSAAMASTDADLWENYDDASQGGEGTEVDAASIRVIARYQGQDLALDSVVDVHADADDTGEDSSQENSKTAADASAGGRACGQLSDDGYVSEAEMTEEERADRARKDSNARMAKKATIDDGYLPDAEATEEEHPKKEERVTNKRVVIEDEGYIPDASEASEVEQIEVYPNAKQRALGITATAMSAAAAAARDVRFETDLETPIIDPATSQSIDEGYLPTDDGLTEEEKRDKSAAAAPPSIDEGYIPDDTLTEEERVHTRPRRGVDEGYLPDGHTTPGDATEEDQGEEVQAALEESQASSVVKEHSPDDDELVFVSKEKDSKEIAAAAVPIETRLDDTIEEGYLPSALEGTEEELSEKEDTTMAMKEMDSNEDVQEASLSPIGSNGGDTNKVEEATMPSVLVATASALQQQGHQGGQAEAGRIAALKDEEFFSDDPGDMKVAKTPINNNDAQCGNDAGEKEAVTTDNAATAAEEAAVPSTFQAKTDEQEAAEDGEDERKMKESNTTNDDDASMDIILAPFVAPVEQATVNDTAKEEEEVKLSVSTVAALDDHEKEQFVISPKEGKDAKKADFTLEDDEEQTPSAYGGDEEEVDNNAKEEANVELEASVSILEQESEADDKAGETALTIADPENPDETEKVPTAPEQGNDNKEENAMKFAIVPEAFSRMKVVELKDKLRELGLPVGGRKQELIDRLNDRLYQEARGEDDEKADFTMVEEKEQLPSSDGCANDTVEESSAAPGQEKTDDDVKEKANAKLKTMPDGPLYASTHEQESEADDKALETELSIADTEKLPESASMPNDGGESVISSMKVAGLKDKLRELGLPLGGRKQELIDRLNDHLYLHLKVGVNQEAGDQGEEGQSKLNAPSKISKKRKPSSVAASSYSSKKKLEDSPSRRSRRTPKPSQKIVEQHGTQRKAAEKHDNHAGQHVTHGTPVSEMAADLDSIDDESAQAYHFTPGKSEPSSSPGIPSSIAVSRKTGGRLPVVPEGQIVEGSTKDTTRVAHANMKAEASTTSSRSMRSTRQTKDDDNDHSSMASSKRRNTRGATKRKAVPDGKESTASTRRSTRSRKASEDVISEEKKQVKPTKRGGRAQPKKAEVDGEGSGSVTTSVSVGTRRTTRSTRSRAKK